VLKASIGLSGTNASSQTFTPFTGMSFISDGLHAAHVTLQSSTASIH